MKSSTPLVGSIALVASLGASACGTPPDRPDRFIDCAADDDYEIAILNNFEVVADIDGVTRIDEEREAVSGWNPWGDDTPNAIHQLGIGTIEDGGRCPSDANPRGSEEAMVIDMEGHNDWGSGMNKSLLTPVTEDNGRDRMLSGITTAAGYEGVSFWARSPGSVGNGITIGLDDVQSHPGGNRPEYDDLPGSRCRRYLEDDYEELPGRTLISKSDVGGVTTLVITGLPEPDECGNNFRERIVISEEWTFYRLPFDQFHQELLPNKAELGLIPDALFQITMIFPKETYMQLWIDDFGFYRKAE